ncbi:HD-GYP domain-containing protein [bacterium]|nr:HD-GYP domain-containing protein [bacterium]
MSAAPQTNPSQTKFFEVRVSSLMVGRVLHHDVYLLISGQPVLFRKKGDVLAADRAKQLREHAAAKLLIPEDQRQAYMDSLKSAVKDPEMKTDDKSKIIKETAYVHIHDLFTKKDIQPVVSEAKNLVEDMVSFVSSDVAAVASLMGLSAHDYYTYNHSVDVAVYSIVIAKKVYGSDNREILIQAGLGGLLHDIGKRRVDLGIINKKGALTAEEWAEIKNHPGYGMEALRDLQSVPEESKCIVHQHHENFDGTGYPNGLGGEQIHKLARVVAIADVFDALTTKRSYHDAISPNEALNIMHGMQPGKFDPNLFKSFDQKFSPKTGVTLASDFDACSPQHQKLIKK